MALNFIYRDPWGLFPTALCQDDVELDPLAEPGPPSSIGGEATTQASSPSEVAREGGERSAICVET